MSPLNRGPLTRLPPAGMRQLPPPRFVDRPVPHVMPLRMLPPRMLPPLNPMYGPRQRLPLPPRSTGGVSRPNGMLLRFPGGPRARGMAPIVPSMGPRGSGVPRGPPMRPWPRRMLPPPPPQMMPPMRHRYGAGNGSAKGKAMGGSKKGKVEELELKKPWMTDEIRNEIQRKNKLYAKAKKNKDAVEWEEFKDLRNKVTKMIRDAKNEYLAKHPEQAHLYPDNEEVYDQRDENYVSSDDDDTTYYCEVCDRDFPSEDVLSEHRSTHMLCGIDGCTFSAHPLLVQKHISMQHRTGLYQRIKALSAPEDIEKWLTERKRKYPTEENIKLRKIEELEKQQRGEVIKQNCNIRPKTKKLVNTREKKRRPRKRGTRETKNSHVPTDETYRGLRPFAGITDWQEETSVVCLDEEMGQTDFCGNINDNISDEDDVPQVLMATGNVPQAFTAAESTNLPTTSLPTVFSLVADYESEDNDEEPEEVPIKKIKQENNISENTIQEENFKQVCEEISNTHSCIGAESNDKFQNTVTKISENTIQKENSKQVCKETSNAHSCIDADDKSNNKFQNTAAKNQDMQECKPNQMNSYRSEKFQYRYRNKLLEKLLSRSIQHERNLICQCVKYIIENNFFDIN